MVALLFIAYNVPLVRLQVEFSLPEKFRLHNFWIALYALIAFLWIFQGIRAAIGMSRLPWLSDTPPISSVDAPGVSVIFAARDEAEKLSGAVQSMLALDYPNFEIVAVNDRSRDRTREILHEFERRSPRLNVIDILELPSGWLGKPHALVAGVEHSRGEWLLFTDADVHFAPDLLSRAIALAQERRLDHLTLPAAVEMKGFWETTTISYFQLGFIFGNEPWKASDGRSHRYVGIGAFQLVRRDAYDTCGGHRRLRMDVIEDMKLGKLIKMAGFRSGMAVAGEGVRVRWHSGARGVIRGVTKNFFAACHYNSFFALAALSFTLLMSVLPFFGIIFATGWARGFAAAAAIAAIGIQAAANSGSGVSPFYGLTHPVGALLFCWMLARSAIVTLWSGGVTWRDTFYPLDELRKGLV
jgi:glycosyltransferase involved in cell wall biosynthesis